MNTGDPTDQGREAIMAALERHNVEYVVIGGAGAQARGWPEPTDDIDLTPSARSITERRNPALGIERRNAIW
jgi:hypothetical protein